LGKGLLDLSTLLSYLYQGARMSLVKLLFFCVSVVLRNELSCLKGDPRIAILFYFLLGSKRLVCSTRSRRHGGHTEADPNYQPISTPVLPQLRVFAHHP
jgi:hypothetical protein